MRKDLESRTSRGIRNPKKAPSSDALSFSRRGGGDLEGRQLEFSIININPRSGQVATRPHKTCVACGCYV